ncbi:vWA domain-containing protein [Gorillibacterium timonense]|uniref:vWA domain-containing protein n=1 Tax=Gorillibacterium timonense TaxID=1689269 RepID=UPI00071CA311|nr:vWA domain-containing protein [Gorillibacterium timonense]
MKIKNRLIAFLAVISLTFAFILNPFTASTARAADTDEKLDVVLAVDVSNSMAESDRNKVANEAMKMFIDMTSVQGDKIGVLAYTDQIVREKALLQVNSAQDKQDLKDFVDQLSRGAYTDIAVGVKESVKILEAGMTPGHRPMIVLLADGNNSLNKGRSQAESDKELADAVEQARQKGIHVYTIGLNADGKLNKTVLEKIATDTGGKAFVTDTAETLPQILSEIFASELRLKVVPLTNLTGNGSYQDVTVSIPNNNVLEANISIVSNKAVDVKLFDPAGKSVPVPSDGVIYSRSSSYSLMKLTKPAEGDWKLQVKGADRDKIDISLVFNYDIRVVMEPLTQTSYKAGDRLKIKAHLESGGDPLTDAGLLGAAKATLVATDLDLKKELTSPLALTGTDFTGEWALPENHRYEVRVRVEDSGYVRDSDKVTVDAAKGTVSASPTPTASAPPAAQPEKEKKPFPWTAVLLGGLLTLLVIAGAIVLFTRHKKANRGFFGQMVVEIRDENTGERLSPQYRKLNAFKGRIRLHQLLQLAPEYAETDKIYFEPGKGDALLLFNRSGCLIERSGRAVDASKGIELRKNDRIKITLQNVNKSIQLEYI